LKKITLSLCLLLNNFIFAQKNYNIYVKPEIGTAEHGHTFPGATLPFAMVQLSPDTRIDGSWDGCSGYHYGDSLIYGFSHTHLSGTGCSDYGDIAFLPHFSETKLDERKLIDEELSASFQHKNELSNAGFYKVKLDNGVMVQLTSTLRVGLQKYSFTKSGFAYIIFNLKHRDKLLKGTINYVSDVAYQGVRISEAWAKEQKVFYHFEMSNKPISSTLNSDSSKIIFTYKVSAGEDLMIKTALSSVEEKGAANNLVSEMPTWDFETIKNNANVSWNLELNKIKTFGGTYDEKVNFYTALYHCMIHPNIMNDIDGRYMGRDHQVHKAEGFNYYTVFSLWDTYRALHPLLNIIDKKRSHDFIMTFKAQFEQSNRLPMWELWGNETNCMIGFHSVSVILDAYQKAAITLEELKSIYPAVKAEAMSNRFGLDKFRKYGYLSIEDESESVSKTLEYSYDFYCISKIAEELKMDEDADFFKKLSWGWRNVYDINSGFMRPRKNGGWLTPFDPKQVNNHYTEANAWQYSFAVPQNYWEVSDNKKLSTLFNSDSKTTGREQSDITGLIGQYAHGNEPSHHISYLFKSQDSIAKYVKKICKEFYKPTPDGLCGNEDCGQMSAWYVFSAMGFYPINPSSNQFHYGSMLFDSVLLETNNIWIYKNVNDLKNNKRFSLRLEAFMDEMPNSEGFEVSRTDWSWGEWNQPIVIGKQFTNQPVGLIANWSDGVEPIEYYFPAPVINSLQTVFKDSLKIEILSNNNFKNLPSGHYKEIYFSIGNEPFRRYFTPFTIYKNSKISSYEFLDYSESEKGKKDSRYRFIIDSAIGYFYKKPNNYSVEIKSKYNKQYTADGDDGLLDGLKGDIDWRKGLWQGYQGQNFVAIVDLKSKKKTTRISSGFLQDTRSWILFPKTVVYSGSMDGKKFKEIASVTNTVSDSNLEVQRKEFSVPIDAKEYRFIKVEAINYGKLPNWHPGAGGDAFIFIDEIVIE